MDVPYVLVVLQPERAVQLLSSEAALGGLLREVHAKCGAVSVSLLLLRFAKFLDTQEKREFDAAVRAGKPIPLSPPSGSQFACACAHGSRTEGAAHACIARAEPGKPQEVG